MIHFFLTYEKDAARSPFGQALQHLGVEHRVYSEAVLLHYRRRAWLVLVGLPKLGFFALRSAWRSLVRSSPVPDVAVFGSHIEALVFRVMKAILNRPTRLYLVGFIFTRRANPVVDALRRLYFGTLFSGLSGVIGYSELEKRKYDVLFPRARGKFASIPYGLYIHGYERVPAVTDAAGRYALSAGRSSRDYGILFEVFSRTGDPLHVICDSQRALTGCVPARNITLMRSCYGPGFQKELEGAGMVIVPLSVEDISAGQMVIIQAMAYRKPIVATRTPTTEEYLVDEDTALLVRPHDADALLHAVKRLQTDPALASRLAENAFRAYLARYSIEAFARNVVASVSQRPEEARRAMDHGHA